MNLNRITGKSGFSYIIFVVGALLIALLLPSKGSSNLFAQDNNTLHIFDSQENADNSTSTNDISKQNEEKQTPLWETDWSNALNILATLLLASVLAGLISYRRHGGSAQMDFTEAHIVLATSSALMMMIIGSQLARAFGLMGAASIVRYRYSLKSPKEASSLVIALGIGMACGVGLYPLAVIASLYIAVVINVFEYMPKGIRNFIFPENWSWLLKVRTSDPDNTLNIVKDILSDENIKYRIKRMLSNKGPNNDQTDIEIDIFGEIDKNIFSERLTGDSIIRVQWKKQEINRFEESN